MLPKKERVTVELVNKVFTEGKNIRSDYFLWKYLMQDKQQSISNSKLRIAVIIPKKVINTAVGRNTMKRKVMNVLKNSEISKVRENTALLVACTAQKAIVEATNEQITQDILKSLHALKNK